VRPSTVDEEDVKEVEEKVEEWEDILSEGLGFGWFVAIWCRTWWVESGMNGM